jgi:hypothetical protein
MTVTFFTREGPALLIKLFLKIYLDSPGKKPIDVPWGRD